MHGGLKDEDRIFTNLYCQGDPFIKVLAATAQLSCHSCVSFLVIMYVFNTIRRRMIKQGEFTASAGRFCSWT